MPFGVKPLCTTCKTSFSSMWRKGEHGEILCNGCGLKQIHPDMDIKDEPTDGCESRSTRSKNNGDHSAKGSVSGTHIGAVRKSARLKPSRHKVQTTTKSLATKGKSRRIVFKKNPIKAPSSVATVLTDEYVFHEGIYYQVGDIVSVMDVDGGIYYAQLRGFLQDQYCNKSAVITWLLPTSASPKDQFDPATFILGPEEELPRKMECFEFVCHAPSDYFRSNTTPYPTLPSKPELGYICTHVGGEIAVVPSMEQVFGLRDNREKTEIETVKPKEQKKEKEIKKEKR